MSPNKITILLASSNKGKSREITELLRAQHMVACSAESILGTYTPVDETGATFAENARLKAQSIWDKLDSNARQKSWVVADDSGLMVEALNGEPGVYSARFSGAQATDQRNIELLLQKLSDCPKAHQRRAQFVCHLHLITPDGPHDFVGYCKGVIASQPQGTGGFGYDPVFIPQGYEQTFAQMPAEVKQRISHRAAALQKLLEFVSQG